MIMKLLTVVWLLLTLVVPMSLNAQQVATIGVGQITVSESVGGDLEFREGIVDLFDRGLYEALLRTRKFTVLDLAQLEARMREQDSNLTGYYNQSHEKSTYLQAGLDYIMTVAISGVDSSSGALNLEFKMIGVADLTNDFSSAVSVKFSPISSHSNSTADLLDQAVRKGVEQVVNKVVTQLFPIRVVSVDEENAQVTLNYGQGFLRQGDTILVYPIEQGFDVNANETLGQPIATIQVSAANQKFARAKANTGFTALMRGQAGLLLRSDHQELNIK